MEKEARRFRSEDEVRYFTTPSKGRGQGIVMTPSFRPGKVVDYDNVLRRYKIRDSQNEDEVLVHPRNLMPSSVSRNPSPSAQEVPNTEISEVSMNAPVAPIETPVQTMVAQTQ